MSPAAPARCQECGSPLADDQRYCLVCGARRGPRSERVQELMTSAAASWDAQPEPTPAAAAVPTPARAPALHLPPISVCALLLAAFLGFGVLMGSAASPSARGRLAASSHPQVRVFVPGGGTATSPSTGTASSPTASSGAEAPATEAEATPAPATAAATHTTSAKAAAPASGSTESGSSGSEGGGEGSSSASPSTGAAKKLPPIKHVFMVVLSDEPYATSFGPGSQATYVTHTLESQGELLVHYDAVAHEELANEIALISGQGPTPQTATNCAQYADVQTGGTGADGQVLGSGCVYPASTASLPSELTAHHLTWRAYLQGSDEPGMSTPACAHPAAGASDPTSNQAASSGPFATFRDPFVYFHAILDASACASSVVGLARLERDLHGSSAPSFAYIAPGRCDDGNPTPCTPGAPAGMAPAEAFLKRVVPLIERSSAYKHGGLIAITVDEAPSSGEFRDSSACCGQPTSYPNLAASTETGHGGGTVGALLLSPYVKGGGISQAPLNHYALLRTIEELFSLPHLGYAGAAGVKGIEPSLFLAKPAG